MFITNVAARFQAVITAWMKTPVKWYHASSYIHLAVTSPMSTHFQPPISADRFGPKPDDVQIELTHVFTGAVYEEDIKMQAEESWPTDRLTGALTSDLVKCGVDLDILDNLPEFHQTSTVEEVRNIANEEVKREDLQTDYIALHKLRTKLTKTPVAKRTKAQEIERNRLMTSIVDKGKRAIKKSYIRVKKISPFAQYYRELNEMVEKKVDHDIIREHALTLVQYAKSME